MAPRRSRPRPVTVVLAVVALLGPLVVASPAVASPAVASPALALVLQAPLDGEAITLPRGRVLCGPVPEGWFADATRRRLRTRPTSKAGQSSEITLAPSLAACSGGAVEAATLVVTGPPPVIDPASVTLWVDAARLELRGDGLEGVRVGWRGGREAGSDVCLNVAKDKGHDVCSIGVDKNLPADPRAVSLRWAPPGGRTDEGAVTYDRAGNPLPDEALELPVGRVLVQQVFPPSRTADVTSGEGRVELLHPDAVSSAECGVARCEIAGPGIVVRAVPAASTTITVRLRLLPRVFLARADTTDNVITETLTVLRCPLTVVSGPPLRNVDDLHVLVRMDKTCAKDVDRLRWSAGGESAEVTRTATLEGGVYVLLWVGRIFAQRLSLVASRSDDGSVVAVATEPTWEVPPLRTSLTLPRFGDIDFIPRNRDALLSVSPISESGKLVPTAVPGAYTVEEQPDGYHVRGVQTAGGYAAFRFSYRVASLPPEFADTNFGVVHDPVQRPIRDANVPVPLAASALTGHPIVELFCRTASGNVESIPSGTSPHIPFAARDSCRLVIHRDLIPAEDGEQRVNVEISVTTAGGTERGDAKQSQHLVLRPDPHPTVVWIHGAAEQFDHIHIRVNHIIDESLYLTSTGAHAELPSAQWTVVTENSRFKFYMTAAIPASLYRFSKDPQSLGTGPLALNFGVLSRFTWLDRDGHDALLGLETGVMGMGLETETARQLAIVLGLGVSVPLGNANQPTQAAVNIHAWVAYSVGTRTGQLHDDAGNVIGTVTLNPWAFVFGPSITIGNIGAFL